MSQSERLACGTQLMRRIQARQMDHRPSGQQVQELYALVDRLTIQEGRKYTVSCKTGCSYCCYLDMTLVGGEAAFILNYVRSHKIPLDRVRLEELSKMSTTVGEPCIFLDEKTRLCRIYRVRPCCCRKHIVNTDPALCDVSGGIKDVGWITSLALDTEISAAMNCLDGSDKMPLMLLNEMNRRGW
jgi:hypothetical protein